MVRVVALFSGAGLVLITGRVQMREGHTRGCGRQAEQWPGPLRVRPYSEPSLAQSPICTGVGFDSYEPNDPTLGCEGARSCGVVGSHHRTVLPVDAGTRAMYGSSAIRQQCYEGAVL